MTPIWHSPEIANMGTLEWFIGVPVPVAGKAEAFWFVGWERCRMSE